MLNKSWIKTGENNDGQRREKPRATFEKTTGNKIYNDGQQNLEQRATKFITMGNEI